MKGIMICESPFMGSHYVRAVEVKETDYTFETSITEDATVTLSGYFSKSSQAKCSKKDTYDFETGALIALMKMCGFDKSYKAIEEAFKYNSYDAKKNKELNILKRDNDKVKDLDVKEYYNKLSEENINLKKEKEQIIVAKNILYNNLEKENEKLKKRINELESYNAKLEERIAGEQRGGYKLLKDMEKLQHDYDLCKNSENALKCRVDYLNKSIGKLNTAIYGYKNDLYNVSKRCRELEEENKELKGNIDELFKSEQHTKSELGRLYFEKHRLEEENEKLKLDCEMLQHGYNDIIFCGGRQNGKQYTFLVNLFKKIDQKKVDAAYKEAYNTTLPVWQKEALRQMYEIRKIEASKYTLPHVREWLYGPPTKREEMWENIFELHKESDVIIKVKREDINTFLHELENKIPEITWVSCDKIFETKYMIKDIYFELKTHDEIYFRLWKVNKLSYSSDSHIYSYRELKPIDYLPPMRWDLFKKGRLAVKVNYYNYKEFYDACEKELGKKPATIYTGDYTVSICKKDGLFQVFTIEHQKTTGKKIINWEDIR